MLPKSAMMKEFEQYGRQKGSSSDAVIGAITNMLREGSITIGDRLPSELEIAEAVGVSRGSVREAMKILSSMGVVEVRRGDGTYISDQVAPSMIEQLMIHIMKVKRDTIQLGEIRDIIERGIMRLAIQNAQEQQITNLWKAQQALEEAVAQEQFTIENLFNLENSFHDAFVRCTNNDLLAIIYNSIIQLFLPARYDEVDVKHHMKTAVIVHPPVIQAIEERNLEKGKEAISQTTAQWLEIFEEE